VSTYDAITILISIAMSTVHSYLYLLDVRWTLIFNALNWYELENMQYNRLFQYQTIYVLYNCGNPFAKFCFLQYKTF